MLNPFDINLDLDKCVAPDILWLYRMKIDGRLPVRLTCSVLRIMVVAANVNLADFPNCDFLHSTGAAAAAGKLVQRNGSI